VPTASQDARSPAGSWTCVFRSARGRYAGRCIEQRVVHSDLYECLIDEGAPDSGQGVVFSAYVNGSHTSGSEYPRTELREYTSKGEPASWSNTVCTHTLTVRHAYTHLPEKRPEIVGAQILSGGGEVLQVRLNNPNIVVYGPGGNPVIEPKYTLGTAVTVEVVAANGGIQVSLDGEVKYKIAHSGSGWYFKTGAYVQSNLNYDDPSQYGEVLVYNVTVAHTN